MVRTVQYTGRHPCRQPAGSRLAARQHAGTAGSLAGQSPVTPLVNGDVFANSFLEEQVNNYDIIITTGMPTSGCT
jgi:hypothetical protein